MTNKNIAFLVLSCDKYSDLWTPFAQLFERYWPDCPFDKYFASNQIPFDKYEFQPILMGEDKTWSSGLISVLNQLKGKYKYVFITLEDVMIMDTVDTRFVTSCINECINRDGNYLKMYKKTIFQKSTKPYIEETRYNIPYRHNCVYALWKIETLLNMLVPEENAWEFEKIGAQRTATIDRFYCVVRNAFTLSNTVVKGKWVKRELNKIRKEIPDIKPSREILSAKEEQRLYWQEKLFRYFFSYVPRLIQNLLLKLFLKR
jgi:hypothetical protein